VSVKHDKKRIGKDKRSNEVHADDSDMQHHNALANPKGKLATPSQSQIRLLVTVLIDSTAGGKSLP
jgi:hypothetical protein